MDVLVRHRPRHLGPPEWSSTGDSHDSVPDPRTATPRGRHASQRAPTSLGETIRPLEEEVSAVRCGARVTGDDRGGPARCRLAEIPSRDEQQSEAGEAEPGARKYHRQKSFVHMHVAPMAGSLELAILRHSNGASPPSCARPLHGEEPFVRLSKPVEISPTQVTVPFSELLSPAPADRWRRLL